MTPHCKRLSELWKTFNTYFRDLLEISKKSLDKKAAVSKVGIIE